jgi:hypothetical protein
MANPNIVNTANIAGVTATLNVSTTAAVIVSNPVGNSHVYKLNGLFLTNIGGANTTVQVYLNNSTRALVNTYVIYNTTVPYNSTFVAVDKNAPFYMQESDSLYVLAAANSAIHALVTYEDIS